jgi:hypothetical protein
MCALALHALGYRDCHIINGPFLVALDDAHIVVIHDLDNSAVFAQPRRISTTPHVPRSLQVLRQSGFANSDPLLHFTHMLPQISPDGIDNSVVNFWFSFNNKLLAASANNHSEYLDKVIPVLAFG